MMKVVPVCCRKNAQNADLFIPMWAAMSPRRIFLAWLQLTYILIFSILLSAVPIRQTDPTVVASVDFEMLSINEMIRQTLSTPEAFPILYSKSMIRSRCSPSYLSASEMFSKFEKDSSNYGNSLEMFSSREGWK